MGALTPLRKAPAEAGRLRFLDLDFGGNFEQIAAIMTVKITEAPQLPPAAGNPCPRQEPVDL
jgi:hypothetical protein